MKILKQGQLPENRVYQATCNNCKTEFEYRQAEAKVVYDQRDGNYLAINCPLCGRTCTQNLWSQST